jgi:deoxyribose-phosphate aldolase
MSGASTSAELVAVLRAQLAQLGLIEPDEPPPAPDAAAFAARCEADRHALASVIDHTLLRADATGGDVKRHCEEAAAQGFGCVCVSPFWVVNCAEIVKPPLRLGTVAAFPLGTNDPAIKGDEAGLAIGAGAHEVDGVIAIGLLRQGVPEGKPPDPRWLAAVLEDARGLVLSVREAEGPVPPKERRVKLILETPLLDERQKIAGALLAVAAGADFVKTCTGFAGPATVQDVALLRATVGGAAGVKASGGIRDRDTALAMLRAGADRLGSSASTSLLSI